MSEQKGIPKQLLEFKPIINNPDKIEIKQEFEPSEAQLKAKQEQKEHFKNLDNQELRQKEMLRAI